MSMLDHTLTFYIIIIHINRKSVRVCIRREES